MYILGINVSHHPSVCLLKDGEIIFFLEDDRLTKIKHLSWRVLLEEGRENVRIESLDHVKEYTKKIDHVIYCTYGEFDESDSIEFVKNNLRDSDILYDNFHFLKEHHLYHAANAFYSSPFQESACLVMDAAGFCHQEHIWNKEIESMYYFENNTCKEIFKNYGSYWQFFSPNRKGCKPIDYDQYCNYESNECESFSDTTSCGGIFNCLREKTGLEEGKIMGLSPYGNFKNVSDKRWFKYDEGNKIWTLDDDQFQSDVGKYKDPMSFEDTADLCDKIQEETKIYTFKLIEKILRKTNTKNLVLSGGYFLNCVNNYKYVKEFPDINFFIDPICHDGGTSMGAVRYFWHIVLKNKERHPLNTLYLG